MLKELTLLAFIDDNDAHTHLSRFFRQKRGAKSIKIRVLQTIFGVKIG